VFLPRQRILFGGDVAFWYITPAAHNGHVSRWIEAIDRILALDVDIIVPGHGPVGGKRELLETRAYLELLRREVRQRYEAGLRPGQAAADIDLGPFAAWSNSERVVVNTLRLYAEFDGTIAPSTANLVSPDESGRKAMEEYRALTAARTRG
jgi:glyoxylase-like metal-dependent hydrolase (beta-lactamase superfamily II)